MSVEVIVLYGVTWTSLGSVDYKCLQAWSKCAQDREICLEGKISPPCCMIITSGGQGERKRRERGSQTGHDMYMYICTKGRSIPRIVVTRWSILVAYFGNGIDFWYFVNVCRFASWSRWIIHGASSPEHITGVKRDGLIVWLVAWQTSAFSVKDIQRTDSVTCPRFAFWRPPAQERNCTCEESSYIFLMMLNYLFEFVDVDRLINFTLKKNSCLITYHNSDFDLSTR